MLVKDLIALMEKYNKIKERAESLRAKLRAFDPAYDPKDDSKQQVDIDTAGWEIDAMLNSKGIKDNKATIMALIIKLEKIINEMDTDILTIKP